MHEFEILKELGSGSFGRVVKVAKKDGSTKKEFAIKQMKMNELSSKEKDNAVNEVRLLASINSPYVIKYKSAFLEEQKNLLCIVMEYADGGDLQGLMKKKASKGHKFNENFIWQVAFDILSGLKTLHSNKIIHRDIKPANIFFVDGVAKLGDLNVSRVMEGKFAKTQTGTPYYTSPEIWNNKAYDYRCDIWSLGCVLYELCALRPPFMAKDFPGLSRKVTAGYYDPISSLYSKKLQSMIKKCLTVEQSRRPTAEEFLKADVFSYLEQTTEGDVELLDTIRVPKMLKMINDKLPEDQYEVPKKPKTLKFIENQSLVKEKSSKDLNSGARSLKRIGSQSSIRSRSKHGGEQRERILSRDKENRIKAPMNVPMQSPHGYVKLPRIPSSKNLY